MYTIGHTDRFLKRVKKILSPEQLRELPRIFDAVAENPYIGDSLGPSWFREVRLREKRLYYIVDERAALFIAVSDKKQQQDVIESHRKTLDEYRELLRRL